MFSGNKLLLGDQSDGTKIIVLMPHIPVSCLIFSTHLTRLWKATSDKEVPITWDFIYSPWWSFQSCTWNFFTVVGWGGEPHPDAVCNLCL